MIKEHPTPRIALSVRSFVGWSPKSTASYIHTPPQIHASSGSWNRIIDLCIVHHTYMHQGEGSRIIDICIMHTCIRKRHIYTNPGKRCIVTCIIHSGSGTRIIDASCIHTCFRIKGQDHCFVHHTHMHQSQGSRIIDMCIIHTCIKVKDGGS